VERSIGRAGSISPRRELRPDLSASAFLIAGVVGPARHVRDRPRRTRPRRETAWEHSTVPVAALLGSDLPAFVSRQRHDDPGIGKGMGTDRRLNSFAQHSFAQIVRARVNSSG
jgi:hypothetical protein